MSSAPRPWYRELNRYHWFVLTVAALGWLFDTMDQQLFTLARTPAMRELLAESPTQPPAKELVADRAGFATSIFLIGWATGGLVFGVLGDRIGRARTMLWTILLYSIFTGLSALSVGFWDFALYRFLTGLGVGGEFAVGVALVAEVMPDRARPYALGLLQSLSAVGNITAALISMVTGLLVASGVLGSGWRWMFVVGTLPALLAIVIRARLKEPEAWRQQIAAGHARSMGSLGELFGTPELRRRVIVGIVLASAGVIGLWGIGFFMPDLLQRVFRPELEKLGLSAKEVDGKLLQWTGINSIMQNLGGGLGVYSFALVSQRIGRRPTFAISFLAAMFSTMLVYSSFSSYWDMFWMTPLMGFCQLSIFGGYAVYFPELFPTRLRSTGTSFCYNVGRYVAAIGPSFLGLLTSRVYAHHAEPMRYAGVTMCAVFLIGLAALPFAPETRGQPLPE
ncbi:MAG: MFS transporter [Pirellulales bacterium]